MSANTTTTAMQPKDVTQQANEAEAASMNHTGDTYLHLSIDYGTSKLTVTIEIDDAGSQPNNATQQSSTAATDPVLNFGSVTTIVDPPYTPSLPVWLGEPCDSCKRKKRYARGKASWWPW